MFKTFILLKYFHVQTSAIKRKYPILIVRILLVSARTHSISRYIYVQTLCVHKRNVLRFLQHGTYHVVVRGRSHFCQSPKGGGSGVFLLKRKGGPNLFWEKKYQIPQPSSLKKNIPSLSELHDTLDNASCLQEYPTKFSPKLIVFCSKTLFLLTVNFAGKNVSALQSQQAKQ